MNWGKRRGKFCGIEIDKWEKKFDCKIKREEEKEIEEIIEEIGNVNVEVEDIVVFEIIGILKVEFRKKRYKVELKEKVKRRKCKMRDEIIERDVEVVER